MFGTGSSPLRRLWPPMRVCCSGGLACAALVILCRGLKRRCSCGLLLPVAQTLVYPGMFSTMVTKLIEKVRAMRMRW